MMSNIGCKSCGELAMTRSTSEIAVRCLPTSVSSFCSSSARAGTRLRWPLDPWMLFLFGRSCFIVFAAVHRNAWFLFGSALGTDIIMAQTASRDASHGGRGDPGKWDRCPRSAVGQTLPSRDFCGTAALPRWSQRVDATLYPERERWSVRRCVEVIFEALRHQRKQSFGIAGSGASR